MNQKLRQIAYLLSKQTELFLSISFGVFLFVLFFQPFPIENFDFNNKLLLVAGLGAIVYVLMAMVNLISNCINLSMAPNRSDNEVNSYIGSFAVLVLCSVAFPFYLHFVGGISITFYIVFKIIFICLAPAVVQGLHNKIQDLTHQNSALVLEKKLIQGRIEKYEEDILNKTIEFGSENSTETFTLAIAEVVLIKSADNYVEVVYKEGDQFRKKLIRNTLKNVELQIKLYSNFIRCHRICIVNSHFIDKLNKNYNNFWLSIRGYDEQIPVSRQYLLKLKEAL